MAKILIAGGTGLIGSKLIKKLKQKKYEVVLLSTRRDLPLSSDIHYWNPGKNEFPQIDLSGIQACFNLCGAPVFDKPFTAKRRQELINSRILPLEFLDRQFEIAGLTLPQLISASAIGIYPYICLNEVNEDSTTGNGFIPDLVKVWEAAANGFKTAAGISVLRIGIVLSETGGFLSQLAKPIRYFAGTVPGDGKQVISWIHVDDLTDLMIWMMEHRINGTFNAVAPQPATLRDITRSTAKALKRPLLLPDIPVWVLNLIFGDERTRILMSSQPVSSKKIEHIGFTFRFTDPDIAIQQLLKG